MITDTQSGTNISEIESGIYRINTPISIPGGPGRFSFNQYLLAGDAPFVFHSGPRQLFPFVKQAIETILPLEQIAFVGLSHFEADECGALNHFLQAAPDCVPVCGRIAAMTSVDDYAIRPPRALADGEELQLGGHTLRWFDTPHVPHGWDCGLMLETSTRTLLCSDLFTQGGPGDVAVTEADIFTPSEEFRRPMDYFSHAPQTRPILERLALERPRTLACMHGSAWRGDGAAMLAALATALG